MSYGLLDQLVNTNFENKITKRFRDFIDGSKAEKEHKPRKYLRFDIVPLNYIKVEGSLFLL